MKLSRIRRPLPPGIVFITAVALLCFAAGCATPIGPLRRWIGAAQRVREDAAGPVACLLIREQWPVRSDRHSAGATVRAVAVLDDVAPAPADLLTRAGGAWSCRVSND